MRYLRLWTLCIQQKGIVTNRQRCYFIKLVLNVLYSTRHLNVITKATLKNLIKDHLKIVSITIVNVQYKEAIWRK